MRSITNGPISNFGASGPFGRRTSEFIAYSSPLIVTEVIFPGYRNTNGKTLIATSIASPLVILIAGQSNVANVIPTAYTPTHATVYNMNLYDGHIYNAIDPLLGCSEPQPSFGPGNFAGLLGDKIIDAIGATNVVLFPIAMDGTSVDDWVTMFVNRITAALTLLSYIGLVPNAILWGQGEKDNILGTSQSAYSASLTVLIAASRGAGYTGPWFIPKETWSSGTVSAAVQAAQTGIVDHSLGIWAGPDADSLGAAFRQSDNIHFNDAGADAYAGLWQTALHAFGPPF